MNRRAFLLYSLATTALFASNPDMKIKSWTLGKYGDFYFKRMNKNLFIMHGVNRPPDRENMGFNHNVVLIEAKNGLIVIDPGRYKIGLHVLEQIREVSDKPIIAIFNTHDHDDHWFANAILKDAYPDAKIYAHKLMQSAAEKLYGGVYKYRGFTFDKAEKITFADELLDDGDRLTIDSEDFYIQHPKNAHTNNDIAITHLNTNTIIMGDLLMESNLAHFGLDASILGNIEFLDMVNRQEEYVLYVPGHGLSGDKERCFAPYLTFMNIIREETNREIDGDDDMNVKAIRERINLRLQWEEGLNFDHSFIDGYVFALYGELDNQSNF